MPNQALFKLSGRGDFAYTAICLSFAVDSTTNYFSDIPVFVFTLPIYVIYIIFSLKRNYATQLLVGCIIIVICSALSSVTFGTNIPTISDLVFVLALLSSIYHAGVLGVSRAALRLSSFLFILLFVPSFFGVNQGTGVDVFSSRSLDIEYFRVYQQGLYRLPHLAGYLLFYSLICVYISRPSRRISLFDLSILIFTLYCIFLSGTRTPIIIGVLSFIVASFRLSFSSILSVVLFAFVIFLAITNIDHMLSFTYGTILFQYVSFIKTFSDNFSRISRVIIWSNWVRAVSDFSLFDVAFGRGFSSSVEYNAATLRLAIWFHNDFLSFFYCYGLIGFFTVTHAMQRFMSFSWRNVDYFGRSLIIYYLLSSFVNGGYKYMPIVAFSIIAALRRPGVIVADSIGYLEGAHVHPTGR